MTTTMIANEEDILAAYEDAAIKEVELSKLERQKREIDAQALKKRQELVQAKEKIQRIHYGINEIVRPYEDTPELVTRTV
jgi:hypothetical protein